MAALHGKSVAFGDLNSTSSFHFPVAMLLEQGIDPVSGLGKVILAGSHGNALAALHEGKGQRTPLRMSPMYQVALALQPHMKQNWTSVQKSAVRCQSDSGWMTSQDPARYLARI